MAHFFVAADPLRLIAVYSPKCASQTLRAWCTAAIEAATGEPVPDLDLFLVGAGARDRYPDHWKALFVRDPLRRLVSFYVHWVARDSRRWCFADGERRLSLHGKTFRQFLFALQHLHRHGLAFQHHLVPQIADIDGWRFDEVIAVEHLEAGLNRLSRRLGVAVVAPHINLQPYDASSREPATDRPPEWLRRHGPPAAELFYDDETTAIALEIYGPDIAHYRRSTGLGTIADLSCPEDGSGGIFP